MASILDGLNTVKLALSAQQYAMNVSQRNTVNADNPYYTRQDVLFTDPTIPDNWTNKYGFANSVPGTELWAARNRYLDQSISYGLSSLGENLVKYTALREIDSFLQSVAGNGLGASIDVFFNSFTELSSSPTDMALRSQVISTAQTMIDDFKRVYTDIQRVQTSADRHIDDGVTELNKLTERIAELNDRIEKANTAGQLEVEYALRDERQQCLEALLGKASFLYFETESGSITVTTTKGDAIVLGDTSTNLTFGFSTQVADGFQGIFLGGIEITGLITSGEIGGHLQMRDKLIPGYLKQLDDLAVEIMKEVNIVHAAGFDLNGVPGGTFFTFTPSPSLDPNNGAARTMQLLITDAREIAASGGEDDPLNPGTIISLGVGDNTNAKALAEIAVGKLFGGTQTIGEFFAKFIYDVGSDQRVAKENGENQQSVLGKLLTLRDAESGVSLNEEAANLIKYQRAYQASSRFVTILNDLSAEVLNFIR